MVAQNVTFKRVCCSCGPRRDRPPRPTWPSSPCKQSWTVAAVKKVIMACQTDATEQYGCPGDSARPHKSLTLHDELVFISAVGSCCSSAAATSGWVSSPRATLALAACCCQGGQQDGGAGQGR
ncbi:hypothetical protein HaLaN_21381 [Haematococcus lacustris]|uniref:Uncharacterized protein n=1 Tax=Haematococcus lacustris TaxID=44745 RepID=A0A699ZYC7_HAELA|nr:hypothetical protein HaLaN_21381 [Haematococcus lacustris]